MFIRRFIVLSVLCTYLLVTTLAGLGRVVICHSVDGRIAVEAEGAGCCSNESAECDGIKSLVAERQSCDLCTDIPLGQMPSRAAAESVSVTKFPPLDLALTHGVPASGPIVLPPVAIHDAPPSISHLKSNAPQLLLQGIVLRC
jgi:hypothetical protein